MQPEAQRRWAYLQSSSDQPSIVGDDDGSEQRDRRRGLQATAATHESSGESKSARAKSKGGCRTVLRWIPASAVLSLALSIAGLSVVCVGFALGRSAVTEFVRAHQGRKDVTFDLMCPGATSGVIGVVVGTFTYAALHFLINCVTSPAGIQGGRSLGYCKCLIAVLWILLDLLAVTGWCLLLCICFLPLFAHVIYASRLQRGVQDLDLNHYITSLIVYPNLVIRVSPGVPPEPTAFPTFHPALMLFIGTGVVLAAQVLHGWCLASNLSNSRLIGKLNRRRRRSEQRCTSAD